MIIRALFNILLDFFHFARRIHFGFINDFVLDLLACLFGGVGTNHLKFFQLFPHQCLVFGFLLGNLFFLIGELAVLFLKLLFPDLEFLVFRIEVPILSFQVIFQVTQTILPVLHFLFKLGFHNQRFFARFNLCGFQPVLYLFVRFMDNFLSAFFCFLDLVFGKHFAQKITNGIANHQSKRHPYYQSYKINLNDGKNMHRGTSIFEINRLSLPVAQQFIISFSVKIFWTLSSQGSWGTESKT